MVTLISRPLPDLDVNACVSVSCTKGCRFRPRPFAPERYSASVSDLTSNAPVWRVARSGRTVRRPSLVGEWALTVARGPADRISIVLIAGDPRGREWLSLSGWLGVTAVDCPPTRAGEYAVQRVKATNVGSGSTGRWRTVPAGAESEFSFVRWRQRHAVPRTLRGTDGQGVAPPSLGQPSRFEPRSCSGRLESSSRPAPLRHTGSPGCHLAESRHRARGRSKSRHSIRRPFVHKGCARRFQVNAEGSRNSSNFPEKEQSS